MNGELGVFLLLFSLLAALYALAASLIGHINKNEQLVTSARNGLLATWPLLTAASLLMLWLLSASSFNTEFVWSVTETAMPGYLKLTAFWGGQAGSLVFWSWLMSTFTAGAMILNWKTERELMPIVISISAGTLAFFLLLVTFWENPFARFWQTPLGDVYSALFSPNVFLANLSAGLANLGETLPGILGTVAGGIKPLAPPQGSFLLHPDEGQGLNPLLRHPGMIIHPPMLYLGFVGFVVPYAFGMAALVNGDIRDTWMAATRRWTIVAWLFLSLGLILGGWWAYDVLGWGGYWAWDPVENASLMPWLTGTAFLHSVMIQEKRGMLRRWNIVLVIMTYLLVILGTFATRSGFVSSVHSFAQSAIGPMFFVFLAIALVLSVYFLIQRWDDLGSDNKLDSLISRESVFLVNNLIFVSIMVTVGIGTYWPVVTELLAGFTSVERSTVGVAFYEQTTGPMFAALIILMGIAPLTAWQHTNLKRLGKASIWPSIATVVILAGLMLLGVRQPLALFGFALAIWTGSVTLFEFFRATQARTKTRKMGWFEAFWTLFGRNRRRYGGYMIHLGVVLIAVGWIGSNAYQLETQRPLSAGQTITLGDYVMEYETIERFVATDGRFVTRAIATVYRNGRPIAVIEPRVDNYPSGQPMSIPAKVTSPLGDDFYVLLVTWEPLSMASATFKVYYNPLVNWLWGGGFVFILGALIAAWPDVKLFSLPVRSARRGTAPAAGD